MNIGIIIQARMGSTRLPGKILRPFYGGKTLLETLLDNLHKIKGCKIIVATSDNSNNDDLEKFLSERGELVFRGSEQDVLDRFIKAAEAHNVEGIVRICSDNPFMDWHGIEMLVKKATQSDADYIGFRVNDKPSILTHFGFWGEFVQLQALKRVAASTAEGTPAHEHVTYHIYTHPEDYTCEWITCPSFLQGRNDIRLTIDTLDDLQNALQVYTALKSKNDNFSLQEVVQYLDEHEDIKQAMLKSIDLNKK